jgi:hypothetical protein
MFFDTKLPPIEPCLVAGSRQPLAVLLHLLAGVDGRQRRRNPAGLQGVRGIGARTDRHQTEFFAACEDRVANLLAFCVRAPDLEPGAPAMP